MFFQQSAEKNRFSQILAKFGAEFRRLFLLPKSSVSSSASLSISMYLLYKCTQTLPIGTAYAVWTGIGAVGSVLVGIFIFKEPADFWRMFFIVTLIASIIGLKAVSH